MQGPAWAQQLSNTLGYAVTPGEPYFVAGCTTSAQCVFPNAQIPSSAFTEPSNNLLQFVPPENAGDGISLRKPARYGLETTKPAVESTTIRILD